MVLSLIASTYEFQRIVLVRNRPWHGGRADNSGRSEANICGHVEAVWVKVRSATKKTNNEEEVGGKVLL
jgi:hypothetical protein